MNNDYYFPKDTRPLLKPLLSNDRQEIDNFALLLNKCAFYDAEQENKFVLFRKGRKGGKDIRLTPKFDQQCLTEIHKRYADMIYTLNLDLGENPLKFTVDWRLIVGLGNESVYETSMTLHHIYGIPYIPGQAVKGTLRSWFITEIFGKGDLKQAEDDALENSEFRAIFGNPKHKEYAATQGQVFFFDAFPTHLDKNSINSDIMNPHYPDYYSKGKPPADYQNPRPVNFLTVQGATFEFFLGMKANTNRPLKADEKFTDDRLKTCNTLLELVQKALPFALGEHGLGAKTAVGYGYFQQIPLQKESVADHSDTEQQQNENAELLQEIPLSEVERLCKELVALKNDNRGYEIFRQLEKFEGDDRKRLANAIKEHWLKFGKWSGKNITPKQKEKVQSIKAILGE